MAAEDREPLLRDAVSSSNNSNEEEIEEELTQECHCCHKVNQHLLPPKLFYFFFFGANGTLMPYLVLFFKQLGLTPSQVGIVTGLKPFISFLFTPFWGYVADKTNKTKWIFIISLSAYVGGYFAYSFSPAKHVCKLRTNSTKHHQPYMMNHVHRRRTAILNDQHDITSFIGDDTPLSISLFELPQRLQKQEQLKDKIKQNTTSTKKSTISKGKTVGLQQTDVDYNDGNDFDLVEPSWGSNLKSHHSPWTICAAARVHSDDNIQFSEDVTTHVDMKAIFSYLLIVTVVATIFSCALITIVDTATIRKLKETHETHKYGKQRLWGSLGWGITSFGVGAIISMIPLCPGMNNEVNYYPAFYVFAVLLLIAMVIGLKLNFNTTHNETNDDETHVSRSEKIKEGLKLLKSPVYCCFIVTSFYIGITMSIIKTFLFWHLKDIGGTQLLFSIAAAINCAAEVFVYYFSATFIKRVGHIRVLYISLVCYSLRLYYYGLLTHPWYVLAAEPLSGITTAAAWAAMTSFVGLNASPESVTTLQGILHGIHWGLGHGCGEVIGGFMVSWIGAAMTFNVFGTLTWIQLLIFIFVSWLSQKKQKRENIDDKVCEDKNVAKPCCQ